MLFRRGDAAMRVGEAGRPDVCDALFGRADVILINEFRTAALFDRVEVGHEGEHAMGDI